MMLLVCLIFLGVIGIILFVLGILSLVSVFVSINTSNPDELRMDGIWFALTTIALFLDILAFLYLIKEFF